MKIKFKKKKFIYNLVFGVLYLAIGLEGIINQENVRWTKYFFFILGTIHLITFLFEIRNQYLIIENGILKKNILFGHNKEIHLKDIILITEFGEEYKLITEQTVLKINPELIDNNSYNELILILSELNLPSYKTPFSKINSIPRRVSGSSRD